MSNIRRAPNPREEEHSKKPPISKALADLVDNLWPDQLPRNDVSLTDLAFLRGQRSVVEKILDWYRAQNPSS